MTTWQHALSAFIFTLLCPALSRTENSSISPNSLKTTALNQEQSQERVCKDDLLGQLKELEKIIQTHTEQISKGQEAILNLVEQKAQSKASETVENIEKEIKALRALLVTKEDATSKLIAQLALNKDKDIVINNNINVLPHQIQASTFQAFSLGANRLLYYLLQAFVQFGPSVINCYLINQVFCLLKEHQVLLYQLQQTALHYGPQDIPIGNPSAPILNEAAFILVPFLVEIANVFMGQKPRYSHWPNFLASFFN